MKLKQIVDLIHQSAPFSWQESYDNSGIQIGDPEREVHRALLTLELTPDVLKEAAEKACDLVITHHPLIFDGLKRIAGGTPTEQMVSEAIRLQIAVVSVHTNIDNSLYGVNRRLAEKLGLENLRILKPASGMLKKLVTFCPTDHADKLRAALFEAGAGHIGDYDCCSFNLEGRGSFRAGEGTNPFVGSISELHYEKEERVETIFPVHQQAKVIQAMHDAHPYEEVAYDVYALENVYDRVGSGMIGEYDEPVSPENFLHRVKEQLETPVLRHTEATGEMIKKVALCGGSGAFLIGDARKAGAQAFVTADLKYHQFLDNAGKILLVDAGHYETEQHTKELIRDIIQKKMLNFAVLISEVNTNPVRYF